MTSPHHEDWFHIALAHQGRGESGQALAAIDHYIRQFSHNPRARLVKAKILADLRNYGPALDLMDSIDLAENPSERFAGLYYGNHGDICAFKGDLETALRWYDKALAAAPPPRATRIDRGTCYLLMGRMDDAEAEYQAAIEDESSRGLAYYNLAQLRRAQEKYPEALLLCEQALELEPDEPDYQRCREDLEGAIHLQAEPEESETDWYGLACELEDQENHAMALVALQRELKGDARHLSCLFKMALAYSQLGNHGRALSTTKAAEVWADSENVDRARIYHNVMGHVWERMRAYGKASECYGRMIDLLPDYTGGYIFQAGCYSKSGDYETAKRIYQHAAQLEDGHPDEALLNLGFLARAEMKFELARNYAEQALEIDPAYEAAHLLLQDVSAARELELELGYA